ncbi:MAG: RES family NAD+ phosphorylase [Thiotrichales bacterium]
MIDPWTDCRDRLHPAPIAGELIRIVESQEQIATTALVDDLAEQSLLEQLLDAVKPPARAGTSQLHYLLSTPFRYPPLRHGSRFGERFEPSLFYASKTLPTAFAEVAYYRWVFWHGMTVPPPSGRLLTQHTAFGAAYSAARGLRLHEPPCAAHRETLTDRRRYDATQALGRALRATGIQAIEYCSARDPAHGLNVALYVPEALPERAPRWQQAWLCETTAELVRARSRDTAHVLAFAKADCLVDGELPAPATSAAWLGA